ncbi:hypothetical protein Tco_0073972 [Tanacetum coccineum]
MSLSCEARFVDLSNFGEASLQTNVNGIEHEKLSSSSSLTSSSWSDLSLKMKEVGPEGEKQVKEAKDEDVQRGLISRRNHFEQPPGLSWEGTDSE